MARESYYGVSEQTKASQHRLDDAEALFAAERWRGAMYVAGYSIECLLKAKLMRMFDCRHLVELEAELQRRGDLPGQSSIFTHQLAVLLRLTRRLDTLRQDSQLWFYFTLVNRWIPAWRYSPHSPDPEEAEEFLMAVINIRHWIEYNI